jgi:hypothetical protein
VNESATPQTADEAAPEPSARDGRRLMYAGMALVAVSFLLSWWGLTKYRVYHERGVPPEKIPGLEATLDEDEKKEYREELARYDQAWNDNRAQYGEFYKAHFGDNFETELRLQTARSWKSGTIKLSGYSTWTGWVGLLFVVILAAALFASRVAPALEQWSWGFPWAGAILFALFTLMAVTFYFTVPDDNGDGYAQGVSWGNYLAIVGGCLATAGCVFEGMRTIDQGIAAMKARSEATTEEEDEDVEAAAPPPPAKSRLQDW